MRRAASDGKHGAAAGGDRDVTDRPSSQSEYSFSLSPVNSAPPPHSCMNVCANLRCPIIASIGRAHAYQTDVL